MTTDVNEAWKENLVTSSAGIRSILEASKRIAVLGAKYKWARGADLL
jgi:hypothetical protein